MAAGAGLQDPRQAVHPHRAAGAGGALQEGALARQRPRPQVLIDQYGVTMGSNNLLVTPCAIQQGFPTGLHNPDGTPSI